MSEPIAATPAGQSTAAMEELTEITSVANGEVSARPQYSERNQAHTDGNPVWKVTVDRAVCLGSGLCVGAAEGHFVLENNRSRAADSPIPAAESVLLAAQSCPTEAIAIVDATTGQTLFPDEEN